MIHPPTGSVLCSYKMKTLMHQETHTSLPLPQWQSLISIIWSLFCLHLYILSLFIVYIKSLKYNFLIFKFQLCLDLASYRFFKAPLPP